MTTVFDVPADTLINVVAEEFKNNDKINPPAWSNFVKTGVHKERKPENADWCHPDVAFTIPFSSATDSIVLVLVVPTLITLFPFAFALLILSAASCVTI